MSYTQGKLLCIPSDGSVTLVTTIEFLAFPYDFRYVKSFCAMCTHAQFKDWLPGRRGGLWLYTDDLSECPDIQVSNDVSGILSGRRTLRNR